MWNTFARSFWRLNRPFSCNFLFDDFFHLISLSHLGENSPCDEILLNLFCLIVLYWVTVSYLNVYYNTHFDYCL